MTAGGLTRTEVTVAWTLDKILRAARKHGASDVHLVRGVAPLLRLNGEIQPVKGEPLDEPTLRNLVEELLPRSKREQFEKEWQICFSCFWKDLGRFRASVYYHGGCPEMAIRICESSVRSAEELRLPPIIAELTRLRSGLILVTGPTGMGKTTTLNYMIDVINRERRAKIVPIEDPVEYVHENIRSVIVQQEVQTDVHSFQDALRHVLRQDPDVIVIGEMRDLETIETALIAAETGHLVMATLHTPDSVQTLHRIYSVFPANQQNAIIMQLSGCLQAVIAQKLLPRADGKGRVLACEVCIATSAIRNLIRERKEHQIYSEMQMGRKFQMQTMDNALLELYQTGEITYDVALSNAHDPDFIRRRTGPSKKSGPV
ncbi:MAG: PilT/PilU family type 4a pilus ATPase [Planctomycetes bacterium]|nr:PilT/PilU family type 4a pilus ATPase [Planctomycetota bacterium]